MQKPIPIISTMALKWAKHMHGIVLSMCYITTTIDKKLKVPIEDAEKDDIYVK